MNWIKKLFHRHTHEYVAYSNDIPMSTIARWFIHDIGYGEDGLDELIGLTPISKEGITKETEDSEIRLSNLEPLAPFIDSISDIAASVLATIAVKSSAESMGSADDDDEVEPDEAAEFMANLYKSIALSSIIGALSTGISLGLIEVNAVSSGLVDMEGFIDE
jgi:hypothetical protein